MPTIHMDLVIRLKLSLGGLAEPSKVVWHKLLGGKPQKKVLGTNVSHRKLEEILSNI